MVHGKGHEMYFILSLQSVSPIFSEVFQTSSQSLPDVVMYRGTFAMNLWLPRQQKRDADKGKRQVKKNRDFP